MPRQLALATLCYWQSFNLHSRNKHSPIEPLRKNCDRRRLLPVQRQLRTLLQKRRPFCAPLAIAIKMGLSLIYHERYCLFMYYVRS